MRTGTPSDRSRSRMKRSSAPLVSKVPTTSAVRPIRSASGIANTGRASVSAVACAIRRARRRTAQSPAVGQAIGAVDRRGLVRGRSAPSRDDPVNSAGFRPRRPRRRGFGAPARRPRRGGRRRAVAAADRGRAASSPASMIRLMRPLTMMATRIGDRGRDADILLDDEHREILFVRQAEQEVADLRDDQRRKALGRLVHHQQAGIAEQRARDREHLLFAARKLAAAVAAPLRQGAGMSNRRGRPSRNGRRRRRAR